VFLTTTRWPSTSTHHRTAAAKPLSPRLDDRTVREARSSTQFRANRRSRPRVQAARARAARGTASKPPRSVRNPRRARELLLLRARRSAGAGRFALRDEIQRVAQMQARNRPADADLAATGRAKASRAVVAILTRRRGCRPPVPARVIQVMLELSPTRAPPSAHGSAASASDRAPRAV